jgi:hypothetical protein
MIYPTNLTVIPYFKTAIPTNWAAIPTFKAVIPTIFSTIPTQNKLIPTFSHFRHISNIFHQKTLTMSK